MIRNSHGLNVLNFTFVRSVFHFGAMVMIAVQGYNDRMLVPCDDDRGPSSAAVVLPLSVGGGPALQWSLSNLVSTAYLVAPLLVGKNVLA